MITSALKSHSRSLIALSVALLQGVLLYSLDAAARHKSWPATNFSALTALYTSVVLVPLTLQLLSEHLQKRMLWWGVAGVAALCASLGWHFGANVATSTQTDFINFADATIFEANLGVLWALSIPFFRCRLTHGRWRCEYSQLFYAAWQSALTLLLAAAFTGAFWILLLLWQRLFVLLGYRFFHDLFQERWFVFPVTTVTFGAALYLAGSLDRLVGATREQILGLLKWLAPVAALILALFTPTLLFKLPKLLFHGERAISAMWLLWILVVTVLLLNAGYQNGAGEKPYPKFLQHALRAIVPATVVVAATALYALAVRISDYGMTVGRVYGVVVAIIVAAYSLGYTLAALKRGPWLKGIERVNVAVALGVMGLILLMLTPVASPYRLAANSQSRRLAANRADSIDDALLYLRFEAGNYGRNSLKRIAAGKGRLAADAQRMLAALNEWEAKEPRAARRLAANLQVFPRGQTLEPELSALVRENFRVSLRDHSEEQVMDEAPWAILVDLDGDSVDECVMLSQSSTEFYAKRAGKWRSITRNSQDILNKREDLEALRTALQAGDFGPRAPRWNELRIGNRVFRLQLADHGLITD